MGAGGGRGMATGLIGYTEMCVDGFVIFMQGRGMKAGLVNLFDQGSGSGRNVGIVISPGC